MIYINNNAVIINDYERLQDFILFLKIILGTLNKFFEVYKQFGHAPSKSFVNHGV
jgi:hypothetical protein